MSEQALLYILKSCLSDIEILQDSIFGCTLHMYGDHSVGDTMNKLNSIDIPEMTHLLSSIETKRSILNSMYMDIQVSTSPDVVSVGSNDTHHLRQSESTNSLLFPIEDVL